MQLTQAVGRKCASVICEAASCLRYSRLTALLLATCMSHSQSHLFCFLHCVLSHRFSSKRETACSLLRTSRSTMFSCSHEVYEPLEEWSCWWDVPGLWTWLFSMTLLTSPFLLFGVSSRMQLRSHKFSTMSTMSPVPKLHLYLCSDCLLTFSN